MRMLIYVALLGLSRLATDLCAAQPAGEERFTSNVRQLTFEGRRSGEGYFSADGTKIIFQSERVPGNPFYQIYLMDLLTGDTQRVSTGVGKTTCSWLHPSGNYALFASTHQDPDARAKQEQELKDRAEGKERRYAWDYDEHYEIYTKDLQSGQLRRLTQSLGYDAEGSYSPDGRLIVFASNRHAYSQPPSESDAKAFARDKSYLVDIYLMNADGSNVRRLTDAPGYDGGPFFSFDGKKICWRRFSPDGATAEIYTMNADGSDQHPITHLGAMSWAPFFHPSGRYLIFTTNKHGFDNFELYIVDSQGRGEPVRVTTTPGFDGLPVFSPDGKRLAWTTTRAPDKRSQIFIAHWNHQAALDALGYGPAAEPSAPIRPSTSAQITAADLRQHVEFLASDALAGRLTGADGERQATDYAASVFRAAGLSPAAGMGYLQFFDFTAGVSLGPGNILSPVLTQRSVEETLKTAPDKDWRPLSFSRTGKIDPAPIAFAGYGIVAPMADKQQEYDSYVHLDVRGKWVMVLRYMPESISPERRQHLSRYASLRHKAMIARDKGATGLIVVSGPNSKVKEQLVPLGLDGSLAGSSLAAISITDALARTLLQSAGKDLQKLHDELDTGDVLAGFALPDPVKLGGSIDLVLERNTGRNVLARLNAGDHPGKTAVIVGAHIDHLGRGRHAGSLASDSERDAVHHGADDNASGVAAVLEAAQYLADLKRQGKPPLRHDIIFATWSGEELGLLGSSHYIQSLRKTERLGTITACVNLDMVGRYRQKLLLQGAGSSSAWAGLIERANAPVGLSLSLSSDSYLPTDSTSFFVAGIPAISLFTGAHEDYHKPTDTPDKLNYTGLEKIARFTALLARALAMRESPLDYVAQAKPHVGERGAGLRAYLGSIPDYAQDATVKGVKLSGVAKGGPAEKAGVRAGDIVVELAGRKIENIYDYTYAIEALKIGQETTIVVLRGSERKQFTITPASRE